MEHQIDIFEAIRMNAPKTRLDESEYAEADARIYEWFDKALEHIDIRHVETKAFYNVYKNSFHFWTICSSIDEYVSLNIEVLKEADDSITYHYFSFKGGSPSIVSLTYKGKCNLVFKIGDEILYSTVDYKDVFAEKICFPAMTINMFDKNGNEIDFNRRENFIMNKLGFSEHGRIRDKMFKNRSFATLEMTLFEITQFLRSKYGEDS